MIHLLEDSRYRDIEMISSKEQSIWCLWFLYLNEHKQNNIQNSLRKKYFIHSQSRTNPISWQNLLSLDNLEIKKSVWKLSLLRYLVISVFCVSISFDVFNLFFYIYSKFHLILYTFGKIVSGTPPQIAIIYSSHDQITIINALKSALVVRELIHIK